jgi:hypothetical protein
MRLVTEKKIGWRGRGEIGGEMVEKRTYWRSGENITGAVSCELYIPRRREVQIRILQAFGSFLEA